jgi:hypothetical protein
MGELLTLVLALKWVTKNGEGVVVSSDSRATVGPISYEVKKVYPIVLEEDVPLAVAGGAGDASLVKQGYRICERILKEMAVREWERTTPTFEQFEEAVRRIEGAIMERVGELRARGVEPDFSMVLASVDVKGRASIYVFNERGLAEPVHENPGFALLGRGLFTGGALLLNLLGYAAEESYALDLGLLSTFVIDVVSEVDPSVGPFVGESWYMRVEEGKVVLGPLKGEALREYKERSRKRRELLRRLWRLLDAVGEKRVEELLKNIEESLKSSEAKT